MNYEIFSYRNADVILDSKKEIRKEIFQIIKDIKVEDKGKGVRPKLNKDIDSKFRKNGWSPHRIKIENIGSFGEVDFFKDRVAIEVSFTHRSFIGIDLLKLKTLSFSIKNEIDLGVMIVATQDFQKTHFPKTQGSMTFEQLIRYLNEVYKTTIDVPILVIGLKD